MNFLIASLQRSSVRIYLGCRSRNGIAGSQSICLFNMSKRYQASLLNGSTSLHTFVPSLLPNPCNQTKSAYKLQSPTITGWMLLSSIWDTAEGSNGVTGGLRTGETQRGQQVASSSRSPEWNLKAWRLWLCKVRVGQGQAAADPRPDNGSLPKLWLRHPTGVLSSVHALASADSAAFQGILLPSSCLLLFLSMVA